MAIMKGALNKARTPSHRGAFYLRPWRGQLVISKWPRPRGEMKQYRGSGNADDLKQAVTLARYVAPDQKIISRDLAEGTPLQPDDMLIMAMYGRAYNITTVEGVTLYGQRMRNDVSKNLDVLSQFPGTVLYRDVTVWKGLPAGTAGYVLQTNGSGAAPSWVPQSGGGGSPWTPPHASNFTWGSQPSGATFSDGTASLVISAPPLVSTLPAIIWYNGAYPSTPFTVYFGVQRAAPFLRYYGAGMVIGDSSGKYITCARWTFPSDRQLQLVLNKMNSYSSFNSRYGNYDIDASLVYCAITDDGTNLSFKAGPTPDALSTFHTASRTNFLGAPSKIGLLLDPQDPTSSGITPYNAFFDANLGA